MSVQMSAGMAKFYKGEIQKLLAGYEKMDMDNEKISKNDRLIYYTFGFHDSEPPHSIINRKLFEASSNEGEAIPSLWGLRAYESKIKEINEFLVGMKNKNVYVVMNFTRSLAEKKDPNTVENKLWTEDDLMKNRAELFQFCEINGKKIDLFSKKIFVKGNKNQGSAFVVEDYFLYDGKLAPTAFKNKYYKPYKIVVKHELKGYSNQEINLLVKDPAEDINTMNGEGWAIVLKLKSPYIVTLKR